jgi:hypothetical protein
MKGYFYSIYKDSTKVIFINDTDEMKDRHGSDWSHYSILHRVLNFMKIRGFEVGRDPEIQKNYKALNKDCWYGRKKDLEFKAKRYPRGFEIEFFQNVVFENSHGGFYDFDKFEKMPYLIKLLWINESNKIGNFLKELGISENTKEKSKSPEENIKARYVEAHWYPKIKDMNFNLNDLDGTTCEYSSNNKDRDKKTIYNGQIKYFRHWNGRLMRGKVYHNINNMWWVILNDSEYTNVADFQLFDPTPKDFTIRRAARDRKPKEYLDKLENMKKLSDKELLRELKKRGIKVS